MSSIPQWLEAARQQGLLPADASPAPDLGRPWPVVLLTALGAWLAAIPLLLMLGMLFGDFLSEEIGAYLIGAALLAASLRGLRQPGLALFVEQLAVVGLLVGGGLLVFGLFRDMPERLAALLSLGLVLGVAWTSAQRWLRPPLGAVAAGLAGMAQMPWDWPEGLDGLLRLWWLSHGLLALWLLALLQGWRAGRHLALLDALATGWGLAVLALLAWQAGMSLLVGGMTPWLTQMLVEQQARTAQRGIASVGWLLLPWLSLGLALAAALWLARAWPALRRPLGALLGLVLVLLAGLLPTLGGCLLALAVLAAQRRWRLAVAAALAAAWIVGSFYYQLHGSLADKALWLLGLGVLLGGGAWIARRRDAAAAAGGAVGADRAAQGWRRPALLAAAGLLVLLVANGAIWQKERLIRAGRPVFVPLAPADPRSLMQGDFMRLRFALPVGEAQSLLARGAERPRVVAQLDARGVASLSRLYRPGEALAAGEFLIELTPKDGAWTLVSDAFFFEEGQGQRYEAARFGEFRVDGQGRALLVALADEQLRRIAP